MKTSPIPKIFQLLCSEGFIKESDILKTQDGFFFVYKSIAEILSGKDIHDFPVSCGERYLCSKFYDDWFLYAVPNEADYTYSLLKLREQEYDAKENIPADGDVPGVTISFISFACHILVDCLADSRDENRIRLDHEINRVVSRRGQSHHKALKRYFIDPKSEGAYLVATVYSRHIAFWAEDGVLEVPEAYRKLVQRSSIKNASKKWTRLPYYIEELNRKAGLVVCDHSKIYIKNRKELTVYEAAAILATHTGNTSLHSFAAEVEYHAKFLTPIAKIRIPFWGRSIYDSAIRADMIIGDTEFEGPAPFHRAESKIVRRQSEFHREWMPERMIV